MVLGVDFMRPLLVWRGYWIDGENVMSKETGGQAFPFTPHIESKNTEELGMSLRDYFAAKAVQGDLSFGTIEPNASDEIISLFANHYYRIADAMLKARNN